MSEMLRAAGKALGRSESLRPGMGNFPIAIPLVRGFDMPVGAK